VDGVSVTLDDTYFFPRGGGQTGDSGTIGGVKVADTVAVNGRIVHILESAPPFKAGDVVECSIDWEKRYRKMRLHSASHIVYYLMKEVSAMHAPSRPPGCWTRTRRGPTTCSRHPWIRRS